MYLSLTKGRIKKTVAVGPRILVDVGSRGEAIGVEFIFVSEKIPKSELRSFSRRISAKA